MESISVHISVIKSFQLNRSVHPLGYLLGCAIAWHPPGSGAMARKALVSLPERKF